MTQTDMFPFSCVVMVQMVVHGLVRDVVTYHWNVW
jgi:hypothetical protein